MPVSGLRTSAPSNLSVLTQDVLGRSLDQIERAALADIFALSEIPDQLPSALAKELAKFRGRMEIAIRDLRTVAGLAEFFTELAAVPAGYVPTCLRDVVLGMKDDIVNEDAIEALGALETAWTETAPEALVLPAEDPKAKKAAPKKKAATARKRTTTVVDERREEWIREDVTARLANYGSTGLKEPVVIAGARHRAPWDDLSEAEVLVILRRMKREGLLRFSAGRWSANR